MKTKNAAIFIIENDEYIPFIEFDSLEIITEEDLRWKRYHEKYCVLASDGSYYPYNWLGEIPGWTKEEMRSYFAQRNN